MTDRYGFNRRRFLQGSAAVAGGLMLPASLLSACGDDNVSGSALKLARPDRPITLPTAANPIAGGLSHEGGTLQILNWVDYLNPDTLARFEELYGVKTAVTTYDTEEIALNKLRSGAFQPDLIIGLTDSVLPRLVAADLLQPLNKSYLSNFNNVIAGLRDPYYDVGAQYTVPYIIYSTGIGYRADMDVDTSYFDSGNGWDILWDPAYSGRLGILDSYRDVIGSVLHRNGEDINTGDQKVLDAVLEDLREMAAATNPKIDILAYTEVPAGTRAVNQCWSGDMLLGVWYLPEDVDWNVLSYWQPDDMVTGNDFFCIPTKSARPVLAHEFTNFFLDVDNALENFGWTGYQPALEALPASTLIEWEYVPPNLENALITPEQYAAGKRAVALEPEVDNRWTDVWAAFNAG
ncbi:uncharacterized protein METZ01_LOCUS3281 [marine metagenome]|uniref:Uncharacterized protein n=1 Tax=marine metagenome TaxID=408172 RepID=A0A381N7G8_9ZZZZ